MVVATLLLGCCAIATIHTPMTSVEVEVDLYSGRKNPAWKLGGTDAAQFLNLVAALPYNSTITPAVPDGLGYRGLRVAVNSKGVAQRFVIADGNVIAEFTKTTDRRNLRDPDRALEKWLLKTGKEQLGVELLEYLLAN